MKEDSELLAKARNAVQVTVTETNKRAGEEQLNSLLNDIKTHLNIPAFMRAAEKKENLHLHQFQNIKEVLDISRVIKQGNCQIVPTHNLPSNKKNKAESPNESLIYILLDTGLIFFKRIEVEDESTSVSFGIF
jgi:hypothetical protein